MIQRAIIFIIFAALLATGNTGISHAGHAEDSGETQFFSSIQDMPLMPGLYELPDQAVMFDKPQGRIIESYAVFDHLSNEDVRAYYERVLPQLGWRRIAENQYRRENETLKLSLGRHEGQNFMRIMIAPYPKNDK